MQQIAAAPAVALPPASPERRRYVAGKLVRTKSTIDFGALIAPDCFWPQPLSIEQAFQVLRFMVKTGQGYETPGRWGPTGVLALLSKRPSCTGHTSVEPIRSLQDLRERFHYALLSRTTCPAMARWRAEHGITPTGKRIMAFPHFKPFEGAPVPFGGCERDIVNAIETLFSRAASVPLAASPNPCHLAARVPCGLRISVQPTRFVFRLDYGLDGSRWDYTLAVAEEDEPFLLGLARAIEHHNALANAAGLSAAEQAERLNALRAPRDAWDDDVWSVQERSPLPILDSAGHPRGRLFH